MQVGTLSIEEVYIKAAHDYTRADNMQCGINGLIEKMCWFFHKQKVIVSDLKSKQLHAFFC